MTEVAGTRSYAGLLRRHAVWVIALLAVAASISGISNGFAYDDVHMIVDNERIHSLAHAWRFFAQTYWPPVDGGTLYRPLTVLAFSLEWAIGRGSPLPFHVTNIALYAAACVTLYRMLCLLTESDVALLAASLFAVHPVHTEAVANVVGQGELLAAVFVFLAVTHYVTARRADRLRTWDIAALCALYLAACLSKEHAVVLPGLLAAVDVVIVREGTTWRTTLRKTAPLFLCMIGVAAAFVAVRAMVTGGFRAAGTNELFGGESFGSRAFTMLNIVVEWVRLLVWPAQLSADYSYPRTRLATEPSLTMLPGLLVIIGGAAFAWRVRRSAPVVAFAVLWIAVAMAIPSNMIVVTGFVLSERALFLASAGSVLLVAAAAAELWRMAARNHTARRSIVAAMVLLIALGIVRSAVRNPVWRDNETLLAQTVEDVPLSSHAHWMLAEHLAGSGRPGPGADEMLLAVVLGRKDDFILLGVAADQLGNSGMCGRAMPLYRRALGLTPQNELLRTKASLCLMRLGRMADARSMIHAGLVKNPSSARLERMTSLIDSVSSAPREASGAP